MKKLSHECTHRPKCPLNVSRWICGKRTLIEDAVARGLITRQSAESLLTKYGTFLSPMSKVYRGEDKPDATQERLIP